MLGKRLELAMPGLISHSCLTSGKMKPNADDYAEDRASPNAAKFSTRDEKSEARRSHGGGSEATAQRPCLTMAWTNGSWSPSRLSPSAGFCLVFTYSNQGRMLNSSMSMLQMRAMVPQSSALEAERMRLDHAVWLSRKKMTSLFRSES